MDKRRKLVKRSSTKARELTPIDLQLILQFLNVSDHLRALRVCHFWSAVGRHPYSWASSIVCTTQQIDALVARGCKKPKTVIGAGLARRNFRPHPEWTHSLRVLHINNEHKHAAPTMTDDTARRTLDGCDVLEELWWLDLHSLPRDFKFPAGLKRLKLQFWITKSCNPPWNPTSAPAGLEYLSLRHDQAPGSGNTVHWESLEDAIPFHLEKLQTLDFEAEGNVSIVLPSVLEFKSTQLKRLHLNVILFADQFEHVFKAQTQLEDLKMPEFFSRPLDPPLDAFKRQTRLQTLWIHHVDGDALDMDNQVKWIQAVRGALPQLEDVFLYDDANNSSEILGEALPGGRCRHAWYEQMENCRGRGEGLVHYIMAREEESDYEESESD